MGIASWSKISSVRELYTFDRKEKLKLVLDEGETRRVDNLRNEKTKLILVTHEPRSFRTSASQKLNLSQVSIRGLEKPIIAGSRGEMNEADRPYQRRWYMQVVSESGLK